MEKIARGTFGDVYLFTDEKTGKKMVQKTCVKDEETSFRTSFREIDLLKRLRVHPYIVKLKSVDFSSIDEELDATDEMRLNKADDNIRLVFEAGDCDLYHFMRRDDYAKLGFDVLKRYMIQMLLAIDYLHRHRIIHRDLKPSNIIIYENLVDPIDQIIGMVRVADFGLAKFSTLQGCNSPGVVTCTYRAPEIALQNVLYDERIDIWSLACIFIEMIGNIPYSNSSQDDENVILRDLVLDHHQALSREEISLITNNRWKKFSPGYLESLSLFKRFPRKSIRERLYLDRERQARFESEAGSLVDFVHLLEGMLAFNFEKRFRISDCLQHPFFREDRVKIDFIISKMPPLSSSTIIVAKQYPERKQLENFIYHIFTHSANYSEWYTHRILFHVIRIFDLYFYKMHKENEYDLSLRYLDTKETSLVFFSCLYLVIKYFASIYVIKSFSSIAPPEFLTEEMLRKAAEIEVFVFANICDCNLYQDTLYEEADNHGIILHSKDVALLLKFIFNENLEGLTNKEAFLRFRVAWLC